MGTFMLAFLSTWEVALLLLLALLLFGSRLPKIARSMGRSVNSFKEGVNDFKAEAGLDEVKEAVDGVKGGVREVRSSLRGQGRALRVSRPQDLGQRRVESTSAEGGGSGTNGAE